MDNLGKWLKKVHKDSEFYPATCYVCWRQEHYDKTVILEDVKNNLQSWSEEMEAQVKIKKNMYLP